MTRLDQSEAFELPPTAFQGLTKEATARAELDLNPSMQESQVAAYPSCQHIIEFQADIFFPHFSYYRTQTYPLSKD